jgi:hypothetical protein
MNKRGPDLDDLAFAVTGFGAAPKKVPPAKMESIARTRLRAASDLRTYP